MDPHLLQAVVDEIAARLTEQQLLRVAHLGPYKYLLRFATATHDNLLISVRPDLPRLHLLPRAGHMREPPPDQFAAGLDDALAGAVLVTAAKLPHDRIVDLTFRPSRSEGEALERHLVIELTGRSADALLLDTDRVVLLRAHDKGEVRSNVVGHVYEPPRAREQDPAYATTGPQSPARPPVSFVCSLRPLDDYKEGDSVGQHEIQARMSTPGQPAGQDVRDAPSHVRRFDSPSEAAQVAFELLETLREFQDRRAHHQSLARKEVTRLQSLVRKLQQDLEKARAADRYRLFGEAILASLPSVTIADTVTMVPDPRNPGGPPIPIPVDPALSPQDNAQRMFDRYKKGKRGVSVIETRLRAAEGRLEAWAALEREAGSLRTSDDLERLRASMSRLGVVHAERPSKRAPPRPARDPAARVSRHTTPEGFVILVGRNGAENDTLTFKVASPLDFWLHAAGSPGAHVVVRNPQRVATLPEGTLRVAAEIAAFYSGARTETKVEVHYTQRKHVQKRKGMPAGQVLLKKFRSIRVAPRLPQTGLESP